jgi:two-component system sensor histidine kinase QseC
MTSIRARLLTILAVATAIVWLCGVSWIAIHTQRELDRMLDQRLGEVGRMVNSLMRSGEIDPMVAAGAAQSTLQPAESGPRNFISCQIWDAEGRLIGRSGGAPTEELSSIGNGFADTMVGEQPWRVFAIVDATRGTRILIGDNMEERQGIVRQVVLGLVAPAALLLPLLAGLIWLSVTHGLRPLGMAAAVLRQRKPADLTPLSLAALPVEVRPMFQALDDLLERLAESRAQEQTFTAFAAHELRTPLAGLRLQAQLAMASETEAERQTALRQIIVAVDRMTALVKQLLELARLDGETTLPDRSVDAASLLDETARQMQPLPCPLQVAPNLRGLPVRVDPGLFSMTLRNLLENAVQQTPAGEAVVCDAHRDEDSIVIAVSDRGPGIPPEELQHIRKRFFRGRHKSVSGSGLGLAIADAAMRKAGGKLRFRNRPEGGLVAEILLPLGQPVVEAS